MRNIGNREQPNQEPNDHNSGTTGRVPAVRGSDLRITMPLLSPIRRTAKWAAASGGCCTKLKSPFGTQENTKSLKPEAREALNGRGVRCVLFAVFAVCRSFVCIVCILFLLPDLSRPQGWKNQSKPESRPQDEALK